MREVPEDDLICSERGALSCESPNAKDDDAPLVYACGGCGRSTCDNCGSGGLCMSCDCDEMADDA